MIVTYIKYIRFFKNVKLFIQNNGRFTEPQPVEGDALKNGWISDNISMKKTFFIIVHLIFISALFAETSGYASWYGGKFQGRLTANGEIFDTNKFTAAHKTLPFGTMVKVTNISNGKSTVVRINDRGPFVEGRIIDLSHAAAEELNMLTAGVAPVKLEVLKISPKSGTLFSFQVGAFKSRNNAYRTVKKLKEEGVASQIKKSSGIYRVVVENVKEDMLDDMKEKLRKAGFSDFLIKEEI